MNPRALRNHISDDAIIRRALSRLDGVKQTGAGRYIAKCPAHDDRSPSLTLRETNDGRVLLHCFSGCATEDVLAAVGLTFSDLFPETRIDHHGPRERPAFYAVDVLRALAHEALVVACAADAMHRGETLAAANVERLGVAMARIREGVDYVA